MVISPVEQQRHRADQATEQTVNSQIGPAEQGAAAERSATSAGPITTAEATPVPKFAHDHAEGQGRDDQTAPRPGSPIAAARMKAPNWIRESKRCNRKAAKGHGAQNQAVALADGCYWDQEAIPTAQRCAQGFAQACAPAAIMAGLINRGGSPLSRRPHRWPLAAIASGRVHR